MGSVDSTRTSAQEVPDLTPSVETSSLLALLPPADLTDPSRASAVDKPSQVVNARPPLSVFLRDNSSVEAAASVPVLPPADPLLRLLTLPDVSERPPLAPR